MSGLALREAGRPKLTRNGHWGSLLGRLQIMTYSAHRSGIYAMQRFVRTLRLDIEAVKNAVTEPWSNGQTEGQVNRLKTLKRSMCGRAGDELLRARMLPIDSPIDHRV